MADDFAEKIQRLLERLGLSPASPLGRATGRGGG